ncbi:hypothetical protein M513_03441 [Trichuris suis]|uniref:Uncharacterized protein n=1 Tax=Trichuris suis TaxID=68888 RepID=A0A085MEP7_9BILA|nr:hypothetical protein M513_03441 [Trichuris suis]
MTARESRREGESRNCLTLTPPLTDGNGTAAQQQQLRRQSNAQCKAKCRHAHWKSDVLKSVALYHVAPMQISGRSRFQAQDCRTMPPSASMEPYAM